MESHFHGGSGTGAKIDGVLIGNGNGILFSQGSRIRVGAETAWKIIPGLLGKGMEMYFHGGAKKHGENKWRAVTGKEIYGWLIENGNRISFPRRIDKWGGKLMVELSGTGTEMYFHGGEGK